MNRTPFLHLALLGLVLALVGTLEAGEPEEPGAAQALYLPGTEPENVVSVRVLTPAGGRLVPVPGARLSGWSEEHEPAAVETTRLVAEGIADEHGFVNVTWPAEGERPFHWLVDAAGMAVRVWDQSSRDVVVVPGAPYALRVLDPMGEPLPRARVEYFIYGCPHSPAARVGTTDAAGEVVLDGLPDPQHGNWDARNEWGQLWIVAEGVEPGPYGMPGPGSEGAPSVLLTRVGRSAHGVVHDEAGRPAAGIVVREIGYPRGPATRTDAQGRFRIIGLSDSDGIAFYDPGDPLPERPHAVVEDFEADVPIRLTLRRGHPTVLGQGEATEIAEVEVRVRSSTQAPPSPRDDVPVRFVRLADGLTVTGLTGEPSSGLHRASLPAGRYRVRVGGGFSPVVEATKAIDVPAAEPVRFLLDKAARLVLRGLDPDEPEWVGLLLPGGMESATEALPRLLNLPPEGPARIQLDRGGPLTLPVGPLEGGVRVATVPAPEPVTVRLRVLSADPDRPVEGATVRWADDEHGWEAGSEEHEGGRWTLSTSRLGTRAITLWAHDFQEETVAVLLRTHVRSVDLGTVRLHPLRPATLRVLDAEGTVVRDLSLHWGAQGEDGNELQEDDGSFALELGPRPTPALLRGDGIYPQPLRLSTEGPAEVRLPGARLHLRVRDAKGRPLASVAYVDDVRVPGEDGEHVLRGIPAGPHTVVVGATGHRGAVRRIDLPADAARTLEFVLPAR